MPLSATWVPYLCVYLCGFWLYYVEEPATNRLPNIMAVTKVRRALHQPQQTSSLLSAAGWRQAVSKSYEETETKETVRAKETIDR